MNYPSIKNNSAVAAIVLAAGLSERMGRFKPLLPLGSRSVIERVVDLFLDAGIGSILVVTGHRAGEIRQAIAPLQVRCVENPDYPAGMFTTVIAGIQSLPSACRWFFIHPADIPLVRTQTVRRLTAASENTPAAVLYPAFDKRRGHPTLIRSCLVPQILRWHGNGGLRAFLQHHDTESIELAVADEAVLMDLDTPDDYRRMQTRLINEGLPSEKECHVLMHGMQTLPHSIAAHCRAVADTAQHLAKALNAAGVVLDSELVRTSALLHDVARIREKHAETGARLLEVHGFSRLAPIVGAHMDLEVDEDQPIDESQVVFLADKLVLGDRRVDLEQRFGNKLEKYGQNASTRSRIMQRRENARRVQAKVERITGNRVASILKIPAPGEGEKG